MNDTARPARAGGRGARRALYLAGFIASRYDPTIKAFRARLEAAGKPPKLAITACARKLLTILDAMIRDQKDYQNQAAGKTVATLALIPVPRAIP